MTNDRRPLGRGGTRYVAAFPRPGTGSAAIPRQPGPPVAVAPIDITPGAPPPVSAAALGRQRHIALGGVLAVVAVAAGGVGYAAIRPAERTRATVPPAVSPPTVSLPTVSVPPVSLPTVSLPAMPFGGAVPPSAATPVAAPVTPERSRSAASPGPSLPAATVPAAPVAAPASPAEPPRTPPPSSAPVPRLTATLSGGGQWTGGGLTGYGGTVRLDNPGRRAAAGWRVTMTVPGDRPVYAGGPVTVTRGGERVAFAPAGPGGVVPPGGSVTFWFWAAGMLPAAPYDCAVDGRPCS